MTPDESEAKMNINDHADRFLARIIAVPESGCWLWEGPVNHNGYGRFRLGTRANNPLIGAHRFAYQMWIGEIPEGMCVLHRCDVRPCVAPSHLFVGSNQDNVDDKMRKGRHAPVIGERHGMAKLTWGAVREIRSSCDGNVEIARRLGVSRSLVSMIRCGHLWRE